MRKTRTIGFLLGGLVAMAALVQLSVAWACVGLVSITTNPTTVQPGGSVLLTGEEFASGAPVTIHLDTLDGPVLATEPDPGMDTMSSKFTISVVIPSTTSIGRHILIASQAEHDMNGGNPARTLIYVGTAAPSAPAAATGSPRLVDLTTKSTTSVGVILGVGVAAAIVGLLIGSVIIGVSGRRRSNA